MKSCSLLLLLWVLTCPVFSQSFHPGGVKGAIQWYSTDTALTQPALRSRLAGNNNLLPVPGASLSSLNFHPSLVMHGRQMMRIDLGMRDLRSASYFTVYQRLDTANENSIWHISHPQTSLVLTTDRMADLSVYQYMNFIDVARNLPKVNVYVQNKEKDTSANETHSWLIGTKPQTPQLPVNNFTGHIPEIIAYDRVLNSRERLQVATYLSLKYGITLTEPGATYLNSAGEKVWDGFDYPAYHRNIAGICRDDSAGLNQTKATSSNMPGLLTITARESLADNSFLLWGDNGKPLTPAPKIAGLPLLLQKNWLMKTYGNTRAFATDLVIDTKPVDAALPVKPVYWLVIDPSGEGKFASSSTVFIKMDKLDRQGKAFFNNVVWDKDGSGKDVWGIMAARELLLATTIDQPACAATSTGSLHIKVVGGKAPFRLQVQSTNGVNIDKQVGSATSPIDVTGLGTGKYFLQVTDAAQNLYTDSFYINNSDAPLPAAIEARYTLSAGRALQLDAAGQMNAEGLVWQWSGPGNFQSFQPQVSITESGLYTLRCSKNGCTRMQDVVVTAGRNNVLYNITVYPNPTPEVFHARVTLDNQAPVTMTVYGPDGKLVSVQKAQNRANYQFTGELRTAGAYELVFTSGLSKTTKRLVIVK